MSLADVNTPGRTSNRVTKGLERDPKLVSLSGQLAGLSEHYLSDGGSPIIAVI